MYFVEDRYLFAKYYLQPLSIFQQINNKTLDIKTTCHTIMPFLHKISPLAIVFIFLVLIIHAFTSNFQPNSPVQEYLRIISSKKNKDTTQIKSDFTNPQKIQDKITQQPKFRYDRNFTIPYFGTQFDSFGVLQNDSIVFTVSVSGEKLTKVFAGPDYQSQIGEIRVPGNYYQIKSQVKFLGDKIYMNVGNNKGQGVYEYTSKQLSETYRFNASRKGENSSGFSGKPLVTDKYIIFHESNDCPSILVINRQTMNSTYLFPDGQTNCNCSSCRYYEGIFKQLSKGRIAYSVDTNIFILNGQNLQVLQKLPYLLSRSEYLDSYYDESTQQQTILARGWYAYSVISLNSQTQTYQNSQGFFVKSYDNSIKLVGVDEGYSSYGNNLVHWSKIKNQILYQDRITAEILPISDFILMAKNESYFIMAGFDRIWIYSLDEKTPKFDIKLLKEVSFSIQVYDYGTISYPKLNSDDRFIIFNNRYQEIGKYGQVVIYDIVEDKTQIIEGAYTDAIVFDTKLDRMVLLAIKFDFDYNKTNYTVQIRKLSQPKTLIISYPLQKPTQDTIYSIRMLTNQNWGLSFLVLYSISQSSTTDSDSYQQICSIEADILTCNEFKNQTISFYRTFITSKWLLSLCATSSYFNHILSVYNFRDLSLVKKVNLGALNYSKIETLYGDTLIIRRSGPNTDQIISFNVASSDPQKFEMRSSFTDLGNQFVTQDGWQSIYFPKKGLFYVFRWKINIKLIFNATFPIDQQINNSSYQYYVSKRNNQTCDWLLYFSDDNYLNIKKNCKPYNQTQKYKLQSNRSSEHIYYFGQCSDKNYVFMKYFVDRTKTLTELSKYLIEIREIGNWSNIKWRMVQVPKDNYLLNVDLTNDQKLIFNYQNYIQITNLPKTILGMNYSLSQIIDFQPSTNGLLGLFGPNIDSILQSPIYTFIVLDQNSTVILAKNITNVSFSTNKRIAFSQNSSQVAVCYQDSMGFLKLEVWEIVSQKRIFYHEFERNLTVYDLKFFNQTQMFLRTNNENLILNIEAINYQSTILPKSPVYAFSQNRDLIAFAVENSTIEIYDATFNLINSVQITFKYYTSAIIFLSFSSNNTLYCFTNTSQMITLTQSPCPPQFQLNSSSYCVCKKYSTLNGSTCQCDRNFNRSPDGSCSCNRPFILQNSTCGCPANSTQQLDKCLCKENFVKQNMQDCTCPSSFVFVDYGKKSYDNLCLLCDPGKYIQKNSCYECSFLCQTCDGPKLSCIKFSYQFILIIIGGALLVLCSIIWIAIKKCKKEKPQKEGQKRSEKGQSEDLMVSETEGLESPLKKHQSYQK